MCCYCLNRVDAVTAIDEAIGYDASEPDAEEDAEEDAEFADSIMKDPLLTSIAYGIEAEEDEARDALFHDPLFPPGRILYLNRVAPGTDSSQANSPSSLLSPEEEVELVEVGNDEFSRVVLSSKMIFDHLCPTYERMLKNTRIIATE